MNPGDACAANREQFDLVGTKGVKDSRKHENIISPDIRQENEGASKSKSKRPDMPIYVPRGRRLGAEPPAKLPTDEPKPGKRSQKTESNRSAKHRELEGKAGVKEQELGAIAVAEELAVNGDVGTTKLKHSSIRKASKKGESSADGGKQKKSKLAAKTSSPLAKNAAGSGDPSECLKNQEDRETIPVPDKTDAFPAEMNSIPIRTDPIPAQINPIPVQTDPIPAKISPIPVKTDPIPAKISPIPVKTDPIPAVDRLEEVVADLTRINNVLTHVTNTNSSNGDSGEPPHMSTSCAGLGIFGETLNDTISTDLGSDESSVHLLASINDSEISLANSVDSSVLESNETCVRTVGDSSATNAKDLHENDFSTVSNKTRTNNLAVDSPSISRVLPVSVEEDLDGDQSWETLFDESGEALNPDIMNQITDTIGTVSIQKPQFDYLNYQPKDPEINEEEFEHLVEIYDFPASLQTVDLVTAFKEFQNSGFEIKWVDDTHAIGVFSGRIAASSVLSTFNHPLMKVRPIHQATRQTKLKAKKCTEFLLPYKPRPVMVASVARNLVAGALGLQTRVSKEKREEERNKIKAARDQKRATKQQKEEAWEGKIGKCAMDET